MKEKRSMKNKLISLALAIAMLLSASVLLLTSCGGDGEGSVGDGKAEKLLEEAYGKLDTLPHTVTVSSYTTSTDSDLAAELGAEKSSVTVTVDGADYSFTETRGDVKITYLFVDGVLYVNESFIGVITKEPLTAERYDGMSDEEYNKAEAEMKERRDEYRARFVDEYLDDIVIEDYSSYTKSKNDDGSTTLILGPITEKMADKLEGELSGWESVFESIKDSYIDRDRSTVTVKLDSEGRMTSVKTVYALAVVYSDGYTVLVSFINEKSYSYSGSELVTPSDADGYIGVDSDYKDLLGQSFTVTTDIITREGIDAEVSMKLQNALGRHSIVYVDKNNYSITYPFTGDSESTYKTTLTNTLIGDTLYAKMEETFGEEKYETLEKYTLTEVGFDYYYKNAVMINFIPTFARGYLDIRVNATDSGSTVITCSALEENYFYELYELLNTGAYPGGKILVPQENSCEYKVTIDENGRYTSSEFAVWVTVLQDAETQIVVGEELIVVRRTFDYAEAEEFYQYAKEGDSWVKAPANAADYKDPYA